MWTLTTAGGDRVNVFDNIAGETALGELRLPHLVPDDGTGSDRSLDEAVSIAVQSYAAPKDAEVKYHTLIAPRFPEKLLYQNADGKCAYDVNGIHPNDLAGQPTVPLGHRTLWEFMGGENWVC